MPPVATVEACPVLCIHISDTSTQISDTSLAVWRKVVTTSNKQWKGSRFIERRALRRFGQLKRQGGRGGGLSAKNWCE